MKTIRLIALLLVTLFIVGCSRQYKEGDLLPIQEGLTTIRWEGEYRLDKAKYYIDGTYVGEGLKGFDAILLHLSRLDIASSLKIEFPEKWGVMRYDGKVDFDWEFPYDPYPEKAKEFSALCGKKSLHLTFSVIKEDTAQ